MLDYFYDGLLGWWTGLPGGDTAATLVYGVLVAALVTGGYAWLVKRREHGRAGQMRVAPVRFFHLRGRGER